MIKKKTRVCATCLLNEKETIFSPNVTNRCLACNRKIQTKWKINKGKYKTRIADL